MTPIAAADLMKCHAANADEVARLGATRRGKRPAAEALQMALWRHREDIVRLVEQQQDERILDLNAALGSPWADTSTDLDR